MNSVVITGASSGIGRATAQLFSQKDWYLILAGRDEKRLMETKQGLVSPKNCELVVGDLSSLTGCQNLISAASNIHDQFPLQTLINNAGIFHRQPFSQTSDDIWIQQFNTNLLSCVRLTRGLIPFIQTTPSANIVNVSSSLGIRPVADTSAYSCAKAALISLTHTLALELAPQIRVNCVAPGMIYTPIHDFYGKETPEQLKTLNQIQPMKRMGTPEEIAEAISYLVGSASHWTTGTVLTIDGGISL